MAPGVQQDSWGLRMRLAPNTEPHREVRQFLGLPLPDLANQAEPPYQAPRVIGGARYVMGKSNSRTLTGGHWGGAGGPAREGSMPFDRTGYRSSPLLLGIVGPA